MPVDLNGRPLHQLRGVSGAKHWRIATTPGEPCVKAIISDIHSNFEALQAVLEDIDKHHVTEIYCLGDVIGYGPNPRECVDLVMKCKMVLLGNHDQGAMFDPEGFNGPAERAIFWTRTQLEASAREPAGARATLGVPRRTAAQLPRERLSCSSTARARNPLNEYVFPEDIYNQRKMERIFALVERYCFQGHTHVPGIFIEQAPDDVYQFHSPEEIDYAYKLDGRKTLCNVGSRRPAARRRLARLLRPARRRHHPLPPRRVRHRNDHQEDLRGPRAGELPRRPSARRPLTSPSERTKDTGRRTKKR